MPYSYITFAQAKQSLGQRLLDATPTFFSDAEKGVYLRQVLQSFNAHANFYREEFTFQGQQDTTWYDMSDVTVMPNTLRPFTITDTDLIQQMEYHLLEPLTSSYPLTWAGSRQFAMSDILNALQQSRDQMLSEANCTIADSTVPAVPGRIFLPDTTIGIRRVAWVPVSSPSGYSLNVLLPLDLFGQQSFEVGFPQSDPGTPLTYRRSSEPPLSFDVDIQPGIPSSYDVHTVDAGATLSASAAAVLRIPNDWCWVAMFGSLAQLFGRESNSADPLRQQYCDMRFKQGLAAIQQAPCVVGARINDVPVYVASVTEGDLYNANWQGAAAGTPVDIYYAGLNLIGLGPKPDSGIYGVTLNVVRNMPLPVADSDFLQIGRDDVGAVLDESQHIAMLKCGGAEFAATFPLHANFLRHCQLYNGKLNALSPYLEFMDGLGREDKMDAPVFQGASPDGGKE